MLQISVSIFSESTTVNNPLLGLNYHKLYLAILVFFISTFGLHAQNESQRQKVKSQTQVDELKKTAAMLEELHQSNQLKLQRLALANGWELQRRTSRGNYVKLQEISLTGHPTYYTTFNIDAARSISTNKVWSNGSLGLSLNGQGMTIGEWDGGGVATGHDEIEGRVFKKDGFEFVNDHANHVAGTLIARGDSPNAKGMAPEAKLHVYNWDNDEAEMAFEAANGMLVSNHSYGYVLGWNDDGNWVGDSTISETEDYRFGFYDNEAKLWDKIAFDAPYYLIVKAAGNDRNDAGPNGENPDGGVDGFDCIGGAGLSKNILTVGAVEDVPNGYSAVTDVVMSSFSSWGPTDDGRIKPDIVGNGVDVYSLGNSSFNYATQSGTSMASPSVAGSLLLLQQHYSNLYDGDFMKSATLKGLAIHTADEAGVTEGPDYSFGWGLMNTAKAAQVIAKNGATSYIGEEVLSNNDTYTLTVGSDGSRPLDFTICWTDHEGNPVAPSLNPTDLMLINDLDIRVTRNDETFFPYVLDPANPSLGATKGDNFRDNVERIHIENPVSGNYTITVSHKGVLEGNAQNFSLIISGKTNCQSLAASFDNSMISAMSFGAIQTSSSNCATFTDYSSLSTLIHPNTPKDIEIQLGTCGAENPRIAKVFIDWNADEDFDDANELAATSPVFNTSGTFHATITPPQNIAIHQKVSMLIICQETTNPDEIQACGEYEFGETERYSLQLANPKPVIQSFTPLSGEWGTVVTVSGQHFMEVRQLLFDNQLIDFNRHSDHTLSFTVPLHVSSSLITLINLYDTVSTNSDFVLSPPQPPVITSFAPSLVARCDTVDIYGEHLFSVQSIDINGISSIAIPVTNEHMRTIVPTTTSGPIHITTLGGEVTSAQELQIMREYYYDRRIDTIRICNGLYTKELGGNSSFQDEDTQVLLPETPGTMLKCFFKELDLRENGYSGTLYIYNGISVDDDKLIKKLTYSKPTDTLYSTDITGALTFRYVSSDQELVGEWKANVFCYTPSGSSIDAISPNSGLVGTSVEITGQNFFGIDAVEINGQAMAFRHLDQTTIRANVPINASSGFITVHSPLNGVAQSSSSFTVLQEGIAMSSDTLYTCDATYYDPGGLDNYTKGIEINQFIYPSDPSKQVSITVTSLAFSDDTRLIVYNGNSSTGVSLHTKDLPYTYTANNLEGNLRLYFSSIYADEGDIGFEAQINCVDITTAPTISSFTPLSALSSDFIEIYGSNFLNINQVSIGGADVEFDVEETYKIRAKAPQDILTGKVSVSNHVGTATSTEDFTLLGIKMGEQDITICDIDYYDPNGLDDYDNNIDITQTLYPESGQLVSLDVYQVGLQSDNSDSLIIYNGTSTNSDIIYTLTRSISGFNVMAQNPDGALTLRLVTNEGGTGDGFKAHVNCISPSPNPVIDSLSANTLYQNEELTIYGHDFIGVTNLQLNGADHEYLLVNDSTIRLRLSADATSGYISIEHPSGNVTSNDYLTVIDAVIMQRSTSIEMCDGIFLDPGGYDPYASSFSLKQTIYPNTPNSYVRINFQSIDIYRDLLVYDGTNEYNAPLLYTIEPDATPPEIVATNSSGALTFVFNAYNPSFERREGWEAAVSCYEVQTPIITGLVPAQAKRHQEVLINGNDLLGVHTVQFNGVDAEFDVLNPQTIKAFVPIGATTGPVTVINTKGTATSMTDFTVLDSTVMRSVDITACDFQYVEPIRTTVEFKNYTQRIYPETPGKYIEIDFTDLDLYTNERIEVYNGTSLSSSKLIKTIYHYTNTAKVASSDLSGAITLRYYSRHTDGRFTAQVSCINGAAPRVVNITSFQAHRGMELEVEGEHFFDITSVEFNGIEADYKVLYRTKMEVQVPWTATSGKFIIHSTHGDYEHDFTVLDGIIMSYKNQYLCEPTPYFDSRGNFPIENNFYDKVTTQTIYPGLQGQRIAVDFSMLDIKNNALTIYDGINSSSPEIGTYIFTNLPPRIVASNPDGALTFRFVSGYHSSNTPQGWEATLSCYEAIPPSIISISPDSGYVDETVIISGEDFLDATSVTFNGIEAVFEIINFNTIHATIPVGAREGDLTVTTPAGVGSIPFKILPGIPMSEQDLYICDDYYLDPGGGAFYPNNTHIVQTLYPSESGKKLKLDFQSFDLADDDELKLYNGTSTEAPLIGRFKHSIPSYDIVGNNPDGALTVEFISNAFYQAAGWAAKIDCYEIPAATITSTDVSQAYIGKKIYIRGHDFFDVTSVKFNGVETFFQVTNNEYMSAIVPNSTTGPIEITTTHGIGVSDFDFTILEGAVMNRFGYGSINICDMMLYDPAGPSSGARGQTGSQTIYPESSDQVLMLAVEYMRNEEDNYRNGGLTIYAGTDYSGKILKENAVTGDTIFTTEPGQPVTIRFYDDDYTTWNLRIRLSCITPTSPVIMNVNPMEGVRGSEVAIIGDDIGYAQQVTFNGVPASFNVIGKHRLQVFVPGEATTGEITVTNTAGSFTTAEPFTVLEDWIIMHHADLYACEETYYDPAGPSAAYTEDNKTIEQKVYPSIPGSILKFNFTEVNNDRYDLSLSYFDSTDNTMYSYSIDKPMVIIAKEASSPVTIRASHTWLNNARLDFAAIISCFKPYDVPVAQDFKVEGKEDRYLRFNPAPFLNHIVSVEEIKYLTISSLPENGNLTYRGNPVSVGTKLYPEYWNTLTFDPNSNWWGTTSFDYTATNENGTSSSATIEIYIDYENRRASVSNIGDFTLCKGETISFDMDDYISDPNGPSEQFDYEVYVQINNLSSGLQFWDLDYDYDETTHELTITQDADVDGTFFCRLIVEDREYTIEKSFEVYARDQQQAQLVQNGTTLTASVGTSYQWYWEGEPILGETKRQLIARKLGRFYAEVTNSGGCLSTTPTAIIDIATGIDITDISNSVNLYPNPANKQVTVGIENTLTGDFKVKILDVSGKVHKEQIIRKLQDKKWVSIDISSLPSGIYVVQITDNNYQAIKRLIKY